MPDESQVTMSLERSEERAAGLSTEEAERVLARVGPNEIAEEKGPSHLRQILDNLLNLFALLLWAAALLALVGGSLSSAWRSWS